MTGGPTGWLVVLLAAGVGAGVAAAGPPLFIAVEPEQTWLVGQAPSGAADGRSATRIAAWVHASERFRKVDGVEDRPLAAAAFRDQGTDEWGLCVLYRGGTEWLDAAGRRTGFPPPMHNVHGFSAGGSMLYVLGDRVVEGRAGEPGTPVLLQFNGRFYRDWPHTLPPPADQGRFPKLIARDDGFLLFYPPYPGHNHWTRHAYRDGRPGEAVELERPNGPPAHATLLACGERIAAVWLQKNVAGWQELWTNRMDGDRWTVPRQVAVKDRAEGESPTPRRIGGDARAAFAAGEDALWMLLRDAEGRHFFGTWPPTGDQVLLREAEPLNRPRGAPPGLSTSMILAVAVLGLLGLLIWRRGARGASWLVRSARIPVAPWPRRIGALLIDLLPAAAVSVVLFGPGWGQIQEAIWSTGNWPPAAAWLAPATLVGVYLLHATVGELTTRQSLGKRMMNLTVVDERGRPARRGQILIRNLLRVVDLLPVVVLVMLLTRYRQRAGDLAARTVVALRRPPPAEKQTEPGEGEAPDGGEDSSAEP
jgi:uncharacterized RDD family membrane protein YckC